MKTRLALVFTGLLLLSGALLLATNYLLMSATLPVATPSFVTGADLDVVTEVNPDAQGAVEAVDQTGYRAAVLNTLLVQSGVTLLLTAVLALVLGRFAANRMLRPVHAVAATARRLSADRLDERIRMRGPRDEMTELADTFDEMLDRLSTSFDSQRRFVANASHELRTPLATQRTMVEVAMARPGAPGDLRDLGTRLLAVNDRSEAMIEGLLTLASSDRGLSTKQDVPLDRITEQVLTHHRQAAREARVTLVADITPRTVRGDPVLLERLVTNLVENAIKYNDGGAVWVRVGEDPAVAVSNTGPPVPAEDVPRLVEPFVRLPRDRVGARRGVGLGLSIVASVVTAHGGRLTTEPRNGGGLDVRVTLPPTRNGSIL
ncbi:HAMP domain-containing histidine kinase [Actinokineospora sp. PR83]|uniref:sensor histidine kinase n=1 Tax=Actinokineospora sp. PR83 TaxID=2884908 RepID=UPI0027DF0DC6|nr:HAMP domain-containing sensor histidine kinase [Actinokineospora sp. PR83]MCG8914308.1 HAMP domain-containing histidine kinase [Actinokineospora sp. PR83]